MFLYLHGTVSPVQKPELTKKLHSGEDSRYFQTVDLTFFPSASGKEPLLNNLLTLPGSDDF